MVSKKDKLIEFIKKQISIDITPYIDLENSDRRMLNLDWDDIPQNEKRQIEMLAHRYDKEFYSVEDNGGLGQALVFKKNI